MIVEDKEITDDWFLSDETWEEYVAKPNKPEEGKQYLLIGGTDQPSIANGNTWAESEIKEASDG